MIKLEKKHIKSASLMLTRAFKDDDMKEVFPDAEERRLKTPIVNEFLLRRNYSHAMAFITSANLEGIAVWVQSDKTGNISFCQMLASGAIWPAMRIGRKALKKIQDYDEYVKEKRHKLVPYRHLYLEVLAVDPEYQGKGYAGKLLKGMLSRIDEDSLPCYVETEGEKNAAMYRHFGFEVVDEFVVPNTNEKIIAMLRQAKKY